MNSGTYTRTVAVSEVFGVMLILAITIIVAGIIAAFAGGFSLDTGSDTIRANIVGSFPSDPDQHYVIFDHLSGDPVNLNEIEITLGNRSSSRDRTFISNRKTPSGTGITNYIAALGSDSTKVGVGDRFILYADSVKSDGTWSWQNSGSADSFRIGSRDYLTYEIIDTRSSRIISSGMIAVP